MALSINSNIDSLRAQTQVARHSADLSQTFERLSTGLRINKASDDPAGLGLADKLRADSRIASVAIRNANDGLSVTAIADSALGEVANILSRMAELATQSANGLYTSAGRSALSLEFLALGSEIDRIAQTTSFNSIPLLSNSQNITLQVGFDQTTNSQIILTAVSGTLNALGLAATDSSRLSYSIIDISTNGSTYASANALSAIRNAMDSLSSIRGVIGAASSRLSSAISFLQVARENYIAAESQIRDIDVAKEVADMVRLQVLQQSGIAILAQANQTPQQILKLLS